MAKWYLVQWFVYTDESEVPAVTDFSISPCPATNPIAPRGTWEIEEPDKVPPEPNADGTTTPAEKKHPSQVAGKTDGSQVTIKVIYRPRDDAQDETDRKSVV